MDTNFNAPVSDDRGADQEPTEHQQAPISRRTLLTGLAALSIPVSASLSSHHLEPMLKKGRTIKFGYVSPETGPLAAFGAADAFVINALKPILAKGIAIGGVHHPIEVIVKDLSLIHI